MFTCTQTGTRPQHSKCSSARIHMHVHRLMSKHLSREHFISCRSYFGSNTLLRDMFARIRWRALHSVCTAQVPLQIQAPAHEELCVLCAHCHEQIHGVRCSINHCSDEVVHFGCLDAWKASVRNAVFHETLLRELRSLKQHLIHKRRHDHQER